MPFCRLFCYNRIGSANQNKLFGVKPNQRAEIPILFLIKNSERHL
ncbi:MAG: hypothetical protein AVDCRST_MAG74-352 [uncultured Pyrinomonadaceae bacterium]|uniref:Uncharacterized protein n=1 Tax=uncultured Pyrinomonadaceae bacterium TaxID=2283094 RepID=A0A6J4NCS4_9BACT|nr:MAG: hypothetical protein AVDCRST_MAG74-352 [uncultured Pyrinomonadaceae bacterium]